MVACKRIILIIKLNKGLLPTVKSRIFAAMAMPVAASGSFTEPGNSDVKSHLSGLAGSLPQIFTLAEFQIFQMLNWGSSGCRALKALSAVSMLPSLRVKGLLRKLVSLPGAPGAVRNTLWTKLDPKKTKSTNSPHIG